MRKEGGGRIDRTLFHWINGMAGHSPLLDALGIFLAEATPALILLLTLGLWLWPGRRRTARRRLVVCMFVAIFLALGLNTIPSIVYYRDRPFLKEHVYLLTKGLPSASFPSDHMAAMTALTVVAGRYSRVLGVALWVSTAAVGFNRVFVGVHYPLDVLAGTITGGLMGSIISLNLDLLMPFAGRLVSAVEDLTSI